MAVVMAAVVVVVVVAAVAVVLVVLVLVEVMVMTVLLVALVAVAVGVGVGVGVGGVGVGVGGVGVGGGMMRNGERTSIMDSCHSSQLDPDEHPQTVCSPAAVQTLPHAAGPRTLKPGPSRTSANSA